MYQFANLHAQAVTEIELSELSIPVYRSLYEVLLKRLNRDTVNIILLYVFRDQLSILSLKDLSFYLRNGLESNPSLFERLRVSRKVDNTIEEDSDSDLFDFSDIFN